MKLNVITFWILLASVIGCDDIIEKDISNSRPTFQAPSDTIQVGGDILFLWENVPGATGYEFFLVSPGMEYPLAILADDTVRENRIIVKLDSGAYQCCVTATNSSYRSHRSCKFVNVLKN